MDVIRVVNPATGEEIAAYPEHSAEQIERALAAAHTAQRSWRQISFTERRDLMHGVATSLRSRRTDFALLATTEMGKPLAEAEAEVDKCALTCDYYADNAQRFLADERVETEAEESLVVFEPIGVVLAIMPWNFPFWQVVRFAAPALMAGNGALLKHSPNVSGCALAIERLFLDAGFPAGLFGTLLVSNANTPAVTERLIADPRVAAVTLTGSERAGAAVGAAAGRALKPTVLELGGSDPFVILDDADLAEVAAMAARSRFLNGGQSCLAAKRFIVDVSIADDFERLFVAAVEALPVGDPTDPATRIGPMARADLLDGIDRQVRKSVAAGARVLLGGTPLDRPGSYYAPTILTDVTTDMPVFTEETFGPVAAVIRARDEEHAVELANDTEYGLGASVWTRDIERALRLGRQIQSGALFVNAVVSSDPRLPFGGTRRSGHGRELGAYGIRAFTNVRTVWVGPAEGITPPTSLAE
jgi:succinate-semialdehyde dehydrogenase / glutarate-semialdehyde dehydrogenase